MNKKLISIDLLSKKLKEFFLEYEFDEEDSEKLTDYFITVEAAGVSTHGLTMLQAHMDKLKKGQYSLETEIEFVKKENNYAVIDCKNSIGIISGIKSMNFAIKMAKEKGIYIVHTRNANTYGAAFYYTLLATKQKLIGITFSNSPSAMTAWGGKNKILGTNPLAYGIPAGKKEPILFDMATSIIAKSKINEYKKQGKNIPQGWAVDCNGNPTTNPEEAIKGSVLPVGEHKGYGLALGIDLLAGLLSGAGFLNNINRFYSEEKKGMNVGQVFIALDPKQILGEQFFSEIDEYIDTVKNDEGNVFLPGEKKNEKLKKCLKYGIYLTDELYDYINNKE